MLILSLPPSPLSDRPQAHSDESRLANLLRRVSREDDRDRRLATLKQMRELIVHSENKVVSFGTPSVIICRIWMGFGECVSDDI